jgi:purine-binding chemotaxis protein CheW
MSPIPANTNITRDARTLDHVDEFVTVTVANQLFGLPIERVHDVFIASTLTDVPLAPREIVGLLNLRGRVVMAICLRRRLGLPDAETCRGMAVGLEQGGESYGLLVDDVGEVMRLSHDRMEAVPVHLDSCWSRLARGVFRLERQLLIILDVNAVLALDDMSKAAWRPLLEYAT